MSYFETQFGLVPCNKKRVSRNQEINSDCARLGGEITLFFVEILFGNVVLWHFVRVHFSSLGVISFLNP